MGHNFYGMRINTTNLWGNRSYDTREIMYFKLSKSFV